MLKPLIPIVSDAIAHTFNETIHIATVHAKYGSHHLAMAVASTAQEENNKNQTTSRIEGIMQVHIANENATIVFCIISMDVVFTLFRVKKWTTVYLPKEMPPPKLFF